MGYWQDVQSAAGMGGYFHWVVLGCMASAFILGGVAPRARQRVRAAFVLFAFYFIGMLVCGLLRYRGVMDETATGYRWVHYTSQLSLGFGVINLAGVLLFRVVLATTRVQPAPILRDTLLGLGYVAAALTLLGRHGVDLSGIIATSAVVTAVIGFSLQDTLGNIMGGVALQIERSVAVGDWVRVGDVEGKVKETRWRHTAIETRNWDTVIIPNSLLMKSQVTVLGRRGGANTPHRMWVYFNVDYRHAPADVTECVERALRAEPIPNVATDPPPNCVLKEFKDSYGAYAVRYWLIDLERDSGTSSEVGTRVFVALQRSGISPSIPAQTVFMTLEGRSRAERKKREETDRKVAALRSIAILQPLTDAERTDLAGHLRLAPFRRGEVITRQGAQAHHLYVITRGEVEVRVSAGDGTGAAGNGDSRRLARLSAGDVFGEMGLMTGEPRTATVVAATDVVCYRLDKEGFQDALRRRPEIAEAISHLLAKRKMERDEAAEDLNEEAALRRMDHAQNDLLHRIRRFFTLG